MSNSIWKKPDQKPEPDARRWIYEKPSPTFPYGVSYRHTITAGWLVKAEWAYVDDLIAQADKAERLEKENEAMREEFEVWHGNYKCEIEEKKRLQKAVDLAQERLLSISDGYDIMKADAETIKRLFYTIQDEASETYKGIKQLIKDE